MRERLHLLFEFLLIKWKLSEKTKANEINLVFHFKTKTRKIHFFLIDHKEETAIKRSFGLSSLTTGKNAEIKSFLNLDKIGYYFTVLKMPGKGVKRKGGLYLRHRCCNTTVLFCQI